MGQYKLLLLMIVILSYYKSEYQEQLNNNTFIHDCNVECQLRNQSYEICAEGSWYLKFHICTTNPLWQKEYHRARKGHNINRNKVYSMTTICMLKWNFTKTWLTQIQWSVSCYGLSRAPQDENNSNKLSCAINKRNISWRVAAGKGTP